MTSKPATKPVGIKAPPPARPLTARETAEPDPPLVPPFRIGSGTDLHRLIRNPQRPLMLGGVEISSELALEGHSDADALLHALTDALLGALALGDIGEYFPPTDPQWRDAASTIFLELALREMRARGYGITNVDCTVLAEVPKLSPHRLKIRTRLAELLGIGISQIGLKATTTEKLGAIGRSEGLLVQAVVLLQAVSSPAGRALTEETLEGTVIESEPMLTLESKRKLVERDLASKPSHSSSQPKSKAMQPSTGKQRILKVWTDGASRGNPGPAAIGVVLKDADGLIIHEVKHFLGNTTNNVAEYQALLVALRIAAPFEPDRLEVYADSELMVKQMNGEYKVKDPGLQSLYAQARIAMQELKKVTFTHVRREFNKEADALANQALDEQR